ncbi:MAG: ABC-2 family transporter protein [Bacillota bacterium]
MRAYYELGVTSFRRHMTYRTAALAGLATNFFFGILRVYMFTAVLESGAPFAAYTHGQILAYTGWTQALMATLIVYGWFELMHTVKSGEVVGDLCRPMNYFWFWQVKDLGRAAQATLVRAVPLLVGYRLMFPVYLPGTAIVWLAFVASLITALFMSFAWRFAVSTISFWMLDARGVMSLAYMVSWFLSGFFVPVDVFPAWAIGIVKYTPFPYMLHAPLQVVMGRLAGTALLHAMAVQVCWLTVLWLLCSVLLRLGLRRLVIQGG